jgi:hypothetical protein
MHGAQRRIEARIDNFSKGGREVMQEGTLTNRNDAYNLLSQLGAPERPLRQA